MARKRKRSKRKSSRNRGRGKQAVASAIEKPPIVTAPVAQDLFGAAPSEKMTLAGVGAVGGDASQESTPVPEFHDDSDDTAEFVRVDVPQTEKTDAADPAEGDKYTIPGGSHAHSEVDDYRTYTAKLQKYSDKLAKVETPEHLQNVLRRVKDPRVLEGLEKAIAETEERISAIAPEEEDVMQHYQRLIAEEDTEDGLIELGSTIPEEYKLPLDEALRTRFEEIDRLDAYFELKKRSDPTDLEIAVVNYTHKRTDHSQPITSENGEEASGCAGIPGSNSALPEEETVPLKKPTGLINLDEMTADPVVVASEREARMDPAQTDITGSDATLAQTPTIPDAQIPDTTSGVNGAPKDVTDIGEEITKGIPSALTDAKAQLDAEGPDNDTDEYAAVTEKTRKQPVPFLAAFRQTYAGSARKGTPQRQKATDKQDQIPRNEMPKWVTYVAAGVVAVGVGTAIYLLTRSSSSPEKPTTAAIVHDARAVVATATPKKDETYNANNNPPVSQAKTKPLEKAVAKALTASKKQAEPTVGASTATKVPEYKFTEPDSVDRTTPDKETQTKKPKYAPKSTSKDSKSWEDKCRMAAYNQLVRYVKGSNAKSKNPKYNLKEGISHQWVINAAFEKGTKEFNTGKTPVWKGGYGVPGQYEIASDWLEGNTGRGISALSVRDMRVTPAIINPYKLIEGMVPGCERIVQEFRNPLPEPLSPEDAPDVVKEIYAQYLESKTPLDLVKFIADQAKKHNIKDLNPVTAAEIYYSEMEDDSFKVSDLSDAIIDGLRNEYKWNDAPAQVANSQVLFDLGTIENQYNMDLDHASALHGLVEQGLTWRDSIAAVFGETDSLDYDAARYKEAYAEWKEKVIEHTWDKKLTASKQYSSVMASLSANPEPAKNYSEEVALAVWDMELKQGITAVDDVDRILRLQGLDTIVDEDTLFRLSVSGTGFDGAQKIEDKYAASEVEGLMADLVQSSARNLINRPEYSKDDISLFQEHPEIMVNRWANAGLRNSEIVAEAADIGVQIVENDVNRLYSIGGLKDIALNAGQSVDPSIQTVSPKQDSAYVISKDHLDHVNELERAA